MSNKRNIGKYIIIFLLLLIVASVSYVFLFKEKDNSISVRIESVSKRTIIQKVNAIGKIRPETEVKISSETSGEIIELTVKEGDTVKANQVLVRIKPDIIETQLEQQKAQLESQRTEIEFQKAGMERAKLDFDRIKELFKKQYVPKKDLDQAKALYDQSVSRVESAIANYDRAFASLKQIQRNADRTTITSPIDGIVTALNVESGEKVLGTIQNVGTEMMKISDLSLMNAIVDVDENDVVLLSLGDTARVEVDAFTNRVFNGVVIEIGHSAKTSLAGMQDQVINFEVKIRLIDTDEKLRPGMSCNVDLETEIRSNVLSIPLQAVTVKREKAEENNEKIQKVNNEKKKKIANSIVYIVKNDNTVESREVETGISDEGYIEIISGLKEGEKVVTGSFQAISKLLFNGAEIKIENNSQKKRRS